MSTAALALVLWTPAFWTRAVTVSKSSTSCPSRAGAISSRMPPTMPPVVSPVMGPVGGRFAVAHRAGVGVQLDHDVFHPVHRPQGRLERRPQGDRQLA